MAYDFAASTELPPLHEHPVYSQGMDQIATGRWQQAFQSLQLLKDIYPDDAEVKDLLEQVQMRAALAQVQPRQSSRTTKRPNIRLVIAGLLGVILVALAAYVVYALWINPVIVEELRLRQITSLRNEADEALIAGDYARARQSLGKLRAVLPEDPQSLEALRRIEQVERLSVLYNEAKALMAAGNWDQAIATLTELQSLDAAYRDLPQLLQAAQESQAMDRQFQAAEEAYNDGDWANAIARYEALRQTSLTFRFEEVQARLFESHLRYGQAILEEAGADVGQVSEAISHFSDALKIRPVDAKALGERRLAENYLVALGSEDQDEVIDLLQTIYNERPDYAGNQMAQLLYSTLLKRAEVLLESGDEAVAMIDYQLAAQLLVDDVSEAQEMLTELTAETAP
jgi:outer membrane protein assembly factor BamD (BamD/ComL family)